MIVCCLFRATAWYGYKVKYCIGVCDVFLTKQMSLDTLLLILPINKIVQLVVVTY